MNSMEVLCVLLITLVVIAGAAVYLNSGFSKSKVVSLEQGIVTMRMQIQQVFSASPDYSGLDNATAIKAGVVPKSLVKGNDLKTPWGGEINLSTNDANGSFTIELSGIPGRQKVHDLTREQRQSLLRVLKHFPVEVSAPCPVTDAIVTSGGVKVGEVDPKTMESKLVKNLYFAGELLDTDAYTGGFNLQIAWATGRLAGQSAANEKE